jgi:hypothetical protein
LRLFGDCSIITICDTPFQFPEKIYILIYFGPVIALATVLTMGEVQRFGDSQLDQLSGIESLGGLQWNEAAAGPD